MTVRQFVILLTIVFIGLIIIGSVYDIVSIYLLIPVFSIYITISVLGAIKIGWNYYITSYNKALTHQKVVALTFDDGPHNQTTEQILEVLKKHNAKATFFCIGKNVNPNKSIVQSIVKEGHIIGNHTFYHSNFFDIYSTNRMVNEIDLTNNDIYKLTGVKPLLFRPPFGVTNPLLKSALIKTNMTSIGWSLRSFDTVKDMDRTFNKLIKKTKPGDIVLLHDTLEFSAQLLDNYITWLKSNNYSVLALDKLIKIKVYDD